VFTDTDRNQVRSVEKHFQERSAELQIPIRFAQGRLSASLGMTKGRATLSLRAVARQKVFFIVLGGRRAMSTRDDKGEDAQGVVVSHDRYGRRRSKASSVERFYDVVIELLLRSGLPEGALPCAFI
jgi:hypothetical protein